MKTWLWIFWLTLMLGTAGLLSFWLTTPGEQQVFMPGQTTHGHHQIELACDACHTSPLGGDEVLQDACTNCHGDELKTALDSHPKTKFTNPRNADLIKVLDARYCASCHIEHNPDITHPMGVTFPEDFCVQCHQDIGEERESHEGMGFETCASAGCHNFHDNRALYEDFLLKHQDPATPEDRTQLPADLRHYLTTMDVRWPEVKQPEPAAVAHLTDDIHADWDNSAHGQAGVGCMSCHGDKSAPGGWQEKPDHTTCESCHAPETEGFLSGKHGMRLAHDLSPMTPAMSRLTMQPDSAHKTLTCNSCHAAHEDNRVEAAASACLTCHADEHSQSFPDSPHGQLWSQVTAGLRPVEEAVSCATCHMPREKVSQFGETFTRVNHNQNATLRPNEKMIRPACLNCHSLSFSIDALADPALIRNNFSGQPATHIRSIDMAVERDHAHSSKNQR